MEAVQAVILFGSKTWVLTPWLEKPLKGFHPWAVRQMAGMLPIIQRDGTWVYTPIGEALKMMGIDEIGVYITRHQNTAAQYIASCTIMDLCLAEE